ncbi:MAG TPA: ABC transporter permease subunit [Thermoplasmata archaeon]|nr:ABC transporter permease subunit [Thermoplasmata archaeon]
MSIHAPRYSLPPPSLLPRWDRLLAIVAQGVKERLRALNLVLLSLTYVVVLLLIVVPFYLSSLASGFFGGITLSLFYTPFGAGVWSFFIILLASSVGAGIIAGDVATRSITMYLSRPISRLDYLLAKAAAVGIWLTLATILPGCVGAGIVLALGYVSLPLALEAIGGFLAAGILTVAAFTALSVLLSAISSKAVYAGAGIFGVLLGSEVIAAVVQAISNNPTALYFSLQDDVLAVAQAIFGVPSSSIDPWSAAGVLVAFSAVAFFLTYLRLERVEAVSE